MGGVAGGHGFGWVALGGSSTPLLPARPPAAEALTPRVAPCSTDSVTRGSNNAFGKFTIKDVVVDGSSDSFETTARAQRVDWLARALTPPATLQAEYDTLLNSSNVHLSGFKAACAAGAARAPATGTATTPPRLATCSDACPSRPSAQAYDNQQHERHDDKEPRLKPRRRPGPAAERPGGPRRRSRRSRPSYSMLIHRIITHANKQQRYRPASEALSPAPRRARVPVGRLSSSLEPRLSARAASNAGRE